MKTIEDRFITTFTQAVQLEMEAMRAQLGPFEILLTSGGVLVSRGSGEPQDYRFDVPIPDEKLSAGLECTLRGGDGGGVPVDEVLVTVLAVDGRQVSIRSPHRLDAGTLGRCRLVIYPWFIYERLLQALESLRGREGEYSSRIEQGLRIFGKRDAVRTGLHPVLDHQELNTGQRDAVSLALDRNPAFIWGPPGTGKTTVLSFIVAELLAQNRRVLVTSTTNAAVDQALARLALMPQVSGLLAQGEIVRIGQTAAPTFGAGLSEIIERYRGEADTRSDTALEQAAEARDLLELCRQIFAEIDASFGGGQLALFEAETRSEIDPIALGRLFGAYKSRNLLAGPPDHLRESVAARACELEDTVAGCEEESAQSRRRGNVSEKDIIREARCVLATMTSMYINESLKSERFDAVIIEEAGMAILPAVFYCAALSDGTVTAVGDPRQLPPIVQSEHTFVRRAMGRSIFEVTAPDPFTSPAVALLSTQYRMQPEIGDLVSRLYYSGALEHETSGMEAAGNGSGLLFPDHSLVVIDTQGAGECRRADASWSRYNEVTARLCAALALRAVAAGQARAAVITPYAEQARCFRKALLAGNDPEAAKGGITSRRGGLHDAVECSTVHRFQGNERDVVIIDTVDGPPLPPGRLLTDRAGGAENLLNVSISRAKSKLIIVADLAYYHSTAPDSPIDTLLQEAARTGFVTSMESV